MARSNLFIRNFNITIEVQVSKEITVKEKGIERLQALFTDLQKKATPAEKTSLGTCVALLKWAAACNASCKEIQCRTEKMKSFLDFTFSFYNWDVLAVFVKELDTCVNKSFDKKI